MYTWSLRGGMTTRLQNISTVLMKVHPRAGSSRLSFNTTGIEAVSTLVSSEAAQLGFEVQILSSSLVTLLALGAGTHEETYRKLMLSSGMINQRHT